jgi:MFS family permease
MIAADGLSILGLAYILLTVMTGQSSPWHIYAGVTFSALFVSLLDPSYRASITDLLTQDQYAKASGMVQLAGSSKYLISPVIAGFLYPWCGIIGLLLIDIGTFALTAATTLAVHYQLAHDDRAAQPVPSRGRWWTDFIDGLRSLYTQPGVLTIVAIMAVATFCVGFLETLFPPMMLSFTTPQTLGVVETIAASGMLAGSLIISTIKTTTQYTREMLVGLGLAGLFIIAVGSTPNAIVIASTGFCFFACLPFVNTPAEVLIRTAIPNQTQGRTWGLVSLLSNLGYIAAYTTSGLLADHVFTPLLLDNGAFASTIGRVIGTGPGRGIGLMIITVGLVLALATALLTHSRTLNTM